MTLTHPAVTVMLWANLNVNATEDMKEMVFDVNWHQIAERKRIAVKIPFVTMALVNAKRVLNATYPISVYRLVDVVEHSVLIMQFANGIPFKVFNFANAWKVTWVIQ